MEKLLIAVHSDIFADALAAAFRKDYTVRTCTDGQEALELLNEFEPDALILFLRLPTKDGLTILSQARVTPKIILGIIDHSDPYILRQAELAGIQNIMLMPNVNSVRVGLTQMRLDRNDTPQKDPTLQAQLLLHSLGIPPKSVGWDMLLIGIPLFAANPRQTLGKELYPQIAKTGGFTDGRAVEHAIRECIGKAWRRRDQAVWAKYFPADKDGMIPCPSNSCFIKALARTICL